MQSKDQRNERIKKNDQSLKEICNTIKYTNICLTGASEGEKKEKEKKYLKKWLETCQM